jgi:hypothetical protein
VVHSRSRAIGRRSMQHSLGAGIRLVVPHEFSRTPPNNVPRVDEEPSGVDETISAFELKFDVRLERRVLETGGTGIDIGTEGGDGVGPTGGDTNNTAGTAGDLQTDPTSLESTVKRLTSDPESVDQQKYTKLGYSKQSVAYALCVWGDDEGKVIDFVEAFGKGLEMGIEATILAGALAQCDNELERAVASVM